MHTMDMWVTILIDFTIDKIWDLQMTNQMKRQIFV